MCVCVFVLLCSLLRLIFCPFHSQSRPIQAGGVVKSSRDPSGPVSLAIGPFWCQLSSAEGSQEDSMRSGEHKPDVDLFPPSLEN